MTTTRMLSVVVYPVLFTVGVVAVSSQAGRPEPKPTQVSVTGAIAGYGDPAAIHLTFEEGTFGEHAGSFVANPDGILRAVKAAGPGRHGYILEYFYCDHSGHTAVEDMCEVPSHDPLHYRCLYIYRGASESTKEIEQVRFPAGSQWKIQKKYPYAELAAEGTLATDVVYRIEN